MQLAELIKRGLPVKRSEIQTLFKKYEVDAPVDENSVLYFCQKFNGTPAVGELKGILYNFEGDQAPQQKFADVLDTVTAGLNQVNNIVNPQVQEQKDNNKFFVIAALLVVFIFILK